MKILPFGRSVYLSSPAAIDCLPMVDGDPVFLSLHMAEEFSADYPARAAAACHTLTGKGYRIIADVSARTKEIFGVSDLFSLAQQLGLSALRVDFGLNRDEICALAARMPVAVNASTISAEDARQIAAAGDHLIAIHNFYPRPETGLDEAQFRRKTQALQAMGYKVYAFIAGDCDLRGPIHAGLPTLESQRSMAPSLAYLLLCAQEACNGVLVGDPVLSSGEQARIDRFRKTGEVSIRCSVTPAAEPFLNRPLTAREDSPAGLLRVKESRAYATQGAAVEPYNCITRSRGSITMDNARYSRYSGELMLARQNYPADERVNVVGCVTEADLPLLDAVENGQTFRLEPDGKPFIAGNTR